MRPGQRTRINCRRWGAAGIIEQHGRQLASCALIFACIGLCLSGCLPMVSTAPETPMPMPARTATLRPKETASPTETPGTRWEMYEDALFRATLHKSLVYGHCEWAILGEEKEKVYVWTLCKVNGQHGALISVPAVILLGEQGQIAEVKFPDLGSDYSQSIKELFPEVIRAKMDYMRGYNTIDREHIFARETEGGPPLIVIYGTPLP